MTMTRRRDIRPHKDPDIESSFGCYGAQLCLCCAPGVKPAFACCKPVPPLVTHATDAAFVPSPVRISELFLICHCCCVQNSAYVPATAQDAFGCEDNSTCFCLDTNLYGLQLPLDSGVSSSKKA